MASSGSGQASAGSPALSASVSPEIVAARKPPQGRFSDLLEDERVLGYVLLVPALLLILVFLAYPFTIGVGLALSDKLVGQPANFIGLDNFYKLFDSEIFIRTIRNTFVFTISATVLKATLGMWLALLLNRHFRFSNIIRAAVLLPFIIPTVLSTLVWLWMFDGTFSIFNWTLRWLWQMEISAFGEVLKENWGYFAGPLWLGDPTLAMISVILVNVWRGLPFFAITFLAGLQTVPPELYEAADIDGASGWSKFWHVTLPLIRPIAVVVIVFSVVVTFADFQLVQVLTRGGPTNSTHLLATLAYQLSMAAGNLGEGAAVALFMFPILALIIVGQLWFLRREGVR